MALTTLLYIASCCIYYAFDVHISLARYTIGSMACWLTVDWRCIHSTIPVIASLGHVTVPMEPIHMLY